MILVSHVEHVQVAAQLALSQRETDSSLSMLILASLVEHVLETAQLALFQKANKNFYVKKDTERFSVSFFRGKIYMVPFVMVFAYGGLL